MRKRVCLFWLAGSKGTTWQRCSRPAISSSSGWGWRGWKRRPPPSTTRPCWRSRPTGGMSCATRLPGTSWLPTNCLATSGERPIFQLSIWNMDTVIQCCISDEIIRGLHGGSSYRYKGDWEFGVNESEEGWYTSQTFAHFVVDSTRVSLFNCVIVHLWPVWVNLKPW